jgi:hypothetical protein
MLLLDVPTSALRAVLKYVKLVKVEVGMVKSLVSMLKIGPMIEFPSPLIPHMRIMLNAPKVIPKGNELAKKTLIFGKTFRKAAQTYLDRYLFLKSGLRFGMVPGEILGVWNCEEEFTIMSCHRIRGHYKGNYKAHR